MVTNTHHEQRYRMVEHQIEARGVTDERTLEAMRAVPRERFVPEALAEFAYEDAPLPIDEGQTISQPFVVALMISALELDPEDRVLEIGAGSGYAAAVLGHVARQVYAVERYESLADLARERMARLGYDNITVLCGDGTLGWPQHAPYDGILVSAGGPEVPKSLLGQLAIGGRLVIPVGTELRAQELLRIRRTAEHAYERESLGRVQFVPLIGTEGWSLELNMGQLAREHFGSDAYSIGFGTHHGKVAAASNWNEPMQVMTVRPSHEDSYERLCHESGTRAFCLHLREPKESGVRHELLHPHLERAIGVIYRPETEMLSHYFHAALPAQFDEYIWFDETSAVQPLKTHELAGMPETYPFGL